MLSESRPVRKGTVVFKGGEGVQEVRQLFKCSEMVSVMKEDGAMSLKCIFKRHFVNEKFLLFSYIAVSQMLGILVSLTLREVVHPRISC